MVPSSLRKGTSSSLNHQPREVDMKILVGYYSRTDNTKKMAEAIAEGVRREGITCDLEEVGDIKVDSLLEYSALIFGSPTYYGTMAAELKKLFDDSVKHHGKLTGRIGGAFSSSGMTGGGGETTIMNILDAFMIHGMIVIGNAKTAHYGPLSIGAPDENTISACRHYGVKLARLTRKLFMN
jgi:NAD(P)H dehydrogenase (quinone)